MVFVNYKIKDNAIGQLNTSVTTGATSITLKSGEGANFPALGAGEKFLAVMVQYDGSGFQESNVVKRERVIATARSGDVVTITRGDESDTPLAFDADDYFIATWRAKDAQDMKDEIARLETDKLDASGELRTGLGNHKMVYTDGSGAETELTHGSSGQVLTSNGATSAPSRQTSTVDIGGLTEDTTGDMDADYLIKSDGTNKKILVNKYRASTSEAEGLSVNNKFLTPSLLNTLLELYGVEMIAGTAYTAAQANTQRTTSSTTYTLVKQFTIDYGGSYTISFDMNRNNSSATAYGRIYKNGVAFGTERIKSTTGFETYSENLTFADGDTCELWIKVNNASYQTLVENFNAKYDFQPKFFDNLSVTVDTD